MKDPLFKKYNTLEEAMMDGYCLWSKIGDDGYIYDPWLEKCGDMDPIQYHVDIKMGARAGKLLGLFDSLEAADFSSNASQIYKVVRV